MESILVVDDDEGMRDMLAETLRGWGYEPSVAENGEMGLEKFRSGRFSLVITDIRMPKLDGLSLLRAIKKEDAKVPILVVTGYPTVNSAVESLVEGADYYLVKPINLIFVHSNYELSVTIVIVSFLLLKMNYPFFSHGF